MDRLKTLLSRVRWTSVIALLLLMAVFIFILVKIPFSSSNVQGNIVLDANAVPGRIKLGERSTIEIEVRNTDKYERAEVDVEAKTHDDYFIFVESAESYIVEEGVQIGPQETRRLKFRVRAVPGARPGKYRIDVKAREKNYAESAEDQVYVKVTED